MVEDKTSVYMIGYSFVFYRFIKDTTKFTMTKAANHLSKNGEYINAFKS
jgi:hypothetical protein